MTKHNFLRLLEKKAETTIFLRDTQSYVYGRIYVEYARRMGRRGGLMVRVLDSGSSGPGPGPGPGRGHCVVFLGKTLYSHGASLHSGV